MGIAIASTSLGFLTLLWSFICVIFSSLGQHPRSCEILTVLAVLTGKFNFNNSKWRSLSIENHLQ